MTTQRMKTIELVEETPIQAAPDKHTKQIADEWKVTSRFVTDCRRKAESVGYGTQQPDGSFQMGRKGDNNRWYFTDQDVFILQKARFNTLQPHPDFQADPVDPVEPTVPKTGEETVQQNVNLELYQKTKEGLSTLKTSERKKGQQEGIELAKQRHLGRVEGLLQGRVASDQAILKLADELDSAVQVDSVVMLAELEEMSNRFLEGSF
jgi:hypothetical protein